VVISTSVSTCAKYCRRQGSASWIGITGASGSLQKGPEDKIEWAHVGRSILEFAVQHLSKSYQPKIKPLGKAVYKLSFEF
jgi:hypothetical protein